GLRSTESAAGPFLKVLHDFAEGLTSDRVGAAITRGSVRGRFYLTLWPRTLPARRQLMLSFWVSTSSVRVFVDPPREFEDTERLSSWLADFVMSPEFLESLEIIGEATQLPAEGYLRAQRTGQLSRDDVIVEIAPEVQSNLVDHEEGSAVELTVAFASTIGAGTFDPQRTYVSLESSGVRVDEIRLETAAGGILRIRGIKRSEPDLRAEFDEFDEDVRAQMAQARVSR
ncbi:MAG: hypothetical protein ACMG6S_24460, partial [Byssovorax sp.]